MRILSMLYEYCINVSVSKLCLLHFYYLFASMNIIWTIWIENKIYTFKYTSLSRKIEPKLSMKYIPIPEIKKENFLTRKVKSFLLFTTYGHFQWGYVNRKRVILTLSIFISQKYSVRLWKILSTVYKMSDSDMSNT